MKSLFVSVAITMAAIAALWLVGRFAGFDVSLGWSLGVSLALTLALHFLFTSRGRRGRVG